MGKCLQVRIWDIAQCFRCTLRSTESVVFSDIGIMISCIPFWLFLIEVPELNKVMKSSQGLIDSEAIKDKVSGLNAWPPYIGGKFYADQVKDIWDSEKKDLLRFQTPKVRT